jgi:ribose transport system substrate-binding protein
LSFIAIRLRRAVPVAVAMSLLLLAACSSQKEGTSAAGPSASGGTGSSCANAAQAQQEYERTWQTAEQQLGLSGLKPPTLNVCDVDTTKYKKSPQNGRYKIAFAAQGPTNSWALENEEAFKYHAEQKGVDVLYASANGDATKQVDNIQQLASQSPDAMVVVPMGPGITGQVRAAAQQGIPVVLCAGRLEGDSGAVSTVARSYELQATLWAEWLIKQLGGKGNIAMLSGIAGVPTAEYQKTAAEQVFAQHPDIKIVSKQYTDWSPTKAKTVAANLVAKYPNLDGIWSDSAISDLGVVEAYKAAGKQAPPMTGDSSNAFLKAVKGTNVKFALSAFPPEQSMKCLDIALDALAGKPVPNIVNVESAAYTNADIDKYIRPQCSENLWIPSSLPDELLTRLKLC